ncbi:MAG: hypothetical protein AB4058_16135 [Microcystaceae cyanobacterium]
MNTINYNSLSLEDLRRYVLTHREDTHAFYAYVDRSKAEGKMITIDLDNDDWEDKLIPHLQSDQS